VVSRTLTSNAPDTRVNTPLWDGEAQPIGLTGGVTRMGLYHGMGEMSTPKEHHAEDEADKEVHHSISTSSTSALTPLGVLKYSPRRYPSNSSNDSTSSSA
jgi:hypothetical protein